MDWVRWILLWERFDTLPQKMIGEHSGTGLSIEHISMDTSLTEAYLKLLFVLSPLIVAGLGAYIHRRSEEDRLEGWTEEPIRFYGRDI